MPGVYYNELDPFAAQTLRNLIAAGHIAPGDVDTRSIEDVRPIDLRGYTQCHFFAGVGVWSYALRRAGWGDDRAVWTGSCPCQPFSAAGQGRGLADERHLWPGWYHLIEQCRPPSILGEQVASKDADHWLDLVQDDLEGVAYAFGAVAFPAAGVGAPHIRDRTYWVAHGGGAGLEGGELSRQRVDPQRPAIERGGSACSLGYADSEHPGRDAGAGVGAQGGSPLRAVGDVLGASGAVGGFWAGADWIACRDGKWRPVEPGTFPLAHGAASRVGRLRAYGNAIVAPAAQAWIETVMECMP